MVTGKEARLQPSDPVPALGECQCRIAGQMALEPQFIKLFIVKGTELRRRTTEGPDEPELRGDDVNGEAKPGLLRKLEAFLGLTLHLHERISRRQKDRVQVEA